MTMLTMTPAEVRQGIIDCFQAGVVPFVTSSPGMGKSAIVAKLAQDFGLELIDLRLSQCAPEDLMGLPMRLGQGRETKAIFAPFETFPTETTEIPANKNGWILFLDEMNSAAKSVQAAAYKLVLDRMVGQAKLHPEVFVVAAGNLTTDRAIVNPMSTAMQSRLIHMELALSHKDFMDHAVAARFDSRVLAFLEFRPGLLHKFDPDHVDRTFPCPRTWEFVSKLIDGKPSNKINRTLVAGAVGEGAAVEFATFLEVYASLPSYEGICADPKGVPVPTNPGTLYAVSLLMVDRFTRTSFPQAAIFIKRLPPEHQVVYCRGIHRRDPEFQRNPDFVELRKTLVRYLTEDDAETSILVA
jgi:hypothetical protein